MVGVTAHHTSLLGNVFSPLKTLRRLPNRGTANPQPQAPAGVAHVASSRSSKGADSQAEVRRAGKKKKKKKNSSGVAEGGLPQIEQSPVRTGFVTTKLRANTENDGTWRLYGVKVPADSDPGKDDFSVHGELLVAVARRLDLKDPRRLPQAAVSLVRKSFDARPKLPEKHWVYVVDVPGAVLRAAGAQRLLEKPGQLEKLAALDTHATAAAAPAAAAGPEQPAYAGLQPGSAALDPRGPGFNGAAGAGRKERWRREEPVVVVGSGPAGLYAALTLAEAGIKVVLLERGQPVEVRGRDIGALFVRRKLNPSSNLCYGEGGAGTWSDGKLTTRIGRNSDPVRRVLDALHQFGAPESILVSGKPHLGTDRLVRILRAFREHLVARGAEVRFGAEVDDLMIERGRVAGVRLADGTELRSSRVILAVGHSARDMYRRLHLHDVILTPKPFAMGFRIEHPQALVDRLQYGEQDAQEVQRGKGRYPVADYRLAAEVNLAEIPEAQAASLWDTADAWYSPLMAAHAPAAPSAAAAAEEEDAVAAGEGEGSDTAGAAAGTAGARAGRRGVYSFCMCPGGQIVPTSTSEGELCINGMSFSKRNSVWANSALVVTVSPDDWQHLVPEHGPLAGMALQQLVEREAAHRGGGAFVAPVQRVDDFMEGRESAEIPSSSYRLGVKAAPLHDLYPPHMTAAFRAALARFDRTLPGFAGPQGLLHAAETRTSAPVRVDRGQDLQSLSTPGLYPCGEGAGYAGGIVSAAVDGLRVGTAIAEELTGMASFSAAADYKVQMGY